MDALKKVTQQTLWQLAGKAITSISTIVILAVVTRHYGVEGTGIFTLALTYLAFFYLAADFGLNAYVMPNLLLEKAEVEWRKLLGLRIFWSVVLIVLAIAMLPFLPFQNALFIKSVFFGSLAIFGNSLFVSANAIFQSKLKYNYSIIASSLNAIPMVLFILILVNLNASIPQLLIVHMMGWLLTGAVALYFAKKFVKTILPLFNFEYIWSVFKNAWPISLTLVLNVVYFRLDSFILTTIKSFADVGIYNLAYQVFQSALVLPTFIMNGYYPLMLQRISENKNDFLNDLKKVILIMLGMSILGVIFTLLLSPIIIQIISGGKGFEGSAQSLRILSLSFPAYFVSSVLMWTLVSFKKYKKMLIIY
ncbi:MAG: oligosaccharide flippase family protein, partial [Candidatus Paceibacterales bacterium]